MQTIEDKDILVIINPNSGKKASHKIVEGFHKLAPGIVTIITPTLIDLEDTFRQNIEKFKVFIVAGGDGTVNEALKYLLNKNDKLFGVLPRGSGNGFARELGFEKSIKSLIGNIKKGEQATIDVLSVNGENCINVSGLGFDSFVAHDFHKRNGRGFINYFLSTLKSIFVFKPFFASINTGNEIIKGEFLMLTIANTRQFGNNAIISPQSKPNDGIFELIVVKPFPFLYYPFFIANLFTGKLKESKYLSYIKVDGNVIIESDFKNFHIDGEPKTFIKNLRVEMLKSKINVIKTARFNF